MKIVYIAGPYMGKTHDSYSYHEIERNIGAAREAAAALVREGYGFFCPHLNSAHFEVITPEVEADFWRDMDLCLLKAADAVLMLPRWESSRGAGAERIAGLDALLPIYYSIPELCADLEP